MRTPEVISFDHCLLQVPAVTKPQLISTSMIAVIPGGYLFYLMLMAVLNNLATMPTVLQAASITMLLMTVVMLIFPLYLLIFFGRGSAAAVATAGAATAGRGTATQPATATPEPDEGFDEVFEDEDFDGSSADIDEVFDEDDETFEDADDDLFAGDSEAAEVDDGEVMFEADDEFEFEEFDYDDEEEER